MEYCFYAMHHSFYRALVTKELIEIFDPVTRHMKDDNELLDSGCDMSDIRESRDAWYSLLNVSQTNRFRSIVRRSKSPSEVYSAIVEYFTSKAKVYVARLVRQCSQRKLGRGQNPLDLWQQFLMNMLSETTNNKISVDVLRTFFCDELPFSYDLYRQLLEDENFTEAKFKTKMRNRFAVLQQDWLMEYCFYALHHSFYRPSLPRNP